MMRNWKTLLLGLGGVLAISLPLIGCPAPDEDEPATTAPEDSPTVAPPTPTEKPETPTAVPPTPTEKPETPTEIPETPTEVPTPTATPAPTPTPTAPPTPEPTCDQLEAITIADIQMDDGTLNRSRVRLENLIAQSPLTPEDGTKVQAFYAQEDMATYAGIRIEVDPGHGLLIEPGTALSLCGWYQEDAGNSTVTIDDPAEVTIEPELESSFAPMEVADVCQLAMAELGEQYEGTLVSVSDVAVTAERANALFEVNECLTVDLEFIYYLDRPSPALGQKYDFLIGELREVEGVYHLQPRFEEDMVLALTSWASPQGGTYPGEVTVTLEATEPSATIYYTTDATDPTVESPFVHSGETLKFTTDTTLRFFAWVSDTVNEATIQEEVYIITTAAKTLLISEVSEEGNGQEFIEIYNPTSEDIALKDYYLTDAAYTETDGKVTNAFTDVVNGTVKFKNKTEFLVRFPDDAVILKGEVLVIAVNKFDSSTPPAPVVMDTTVTDYEVTDVSPDVADMVQAGGASAAIDNKQVGLSNGAEFMLLFYWDGASPLVQDVDYVRWREKETDSLRGVDKTGLSKTKGDQTATYKNDTALTSQKAISGGMNPGESFCRVDFSEGSAEVQENGNGQLGSNETSEDFTLTWENCGPYTPGKI